MIYVKLNSTSNPSTRGILCKNADNYFEIFETPFGETSVQIGVTSVVPTEGRRLTVNRFVLTDEPSLTTFLYGLRAGVHQGHVNIAGCSFNGTAVTTEAPTLSFTDIFGVEIRSGAEMTGVTMKAGYTTDTIYSGYSGYHDNRNRGVRFNTPLIPDKPWRIGVELEVYARTQDAYNRITDARTNWFQCERDGSLNERNWPIELKTIPLKACDATNTEFWKEPMATLKTLAVSKACHTTGLHVHIGKEILGDDTEEMQRTLRKLVWFYTYYIEEVSENRALNTVICGRERGYHYSPGSNKTEAADWMWSLDKGRSAAGSSVIFNKMSGEILDKVRRDRGAINLGNLNGIGTVEFRLGKGCIGAYRMAALVTWWEQMCLYCRNTHESELSFETFFSRIKADYPAVAYIFGDEEC